jgi:hypothetical protein
MLQGNEILVTLPHYLSDSIIVNICLVKGTASVLVFNSNAPFAFELMCPLQRKGHRNGSDTHKQRGIESIRSNAAAG